MDALEVDIDGAKKLAKGGSNIYVFAENLGDGEFVKALLEGIGRTEEVDFGEARMIVMHLGSDGDIEELAQKYADSVIVCPHGNTSLRMARSLVALGVKAYSLHGGLAGLRSRAQQ
ncbi:MAG: hypothetical protein KGH67_05050 [Candidatus Micrarchaeota archaeon]|nr:hypothetical protein [Candidatus Micrarchaeota archaeon]